MASSDAEAERCLMILTNHSSQETLAARENPHLPKSL
jgi:hypothetical protein